MATSAMTESAAAGEILTAVVEIKAAQERVTRQARALADRIEVRDGESPAWELACDIGEGIGGGDSVPDEIAVVVENARDLVRLIDGGHDA